jgi:hypothetical protein
MFTEDTGMSMMLGVKRNANRYLVWKYTGQDLFGIHESAWEDYIKGDLKEMGWDGVEWINLA